MEEKIEKILLSIGVPPHLLGFRAITHAVEMILQDPSALDKVTARIYPNVAKKMNSTASRTERAIRNAIESMFDHQDMEVIVQTLGLHPRLRKCKYTNAEFLSLCAMKLRRDFDLR